MSEPYILYGSECSYFTAKVRAYLRAKQEPYVERVNADPGYRQRARVAVGYDVIPIVETRDGMIIQDSVEIIDHLEPLFPKRPTYPQTAVLGWTARFLACYASHFLIRAGLHYRWSFPDENLSFIEHEFGRTICPRGPKEVQIAFGKKIAKRPLGAYRIIGLTPETIPGVEASCEALMVRLDLHFEQHPYLLGGQPTLADYAFMAPFYGHFARDPYPSSLMKRIAPNLFRWTERMMYPGPSPEFHDYPAPLFPDTELPETLTNIMTQAGGEFAGELGQTITAFETWLRDHPEIDAGVQLPTVGGGGSLGSHEISLHGTKLNVPTRLNMIWEHQKSKAFYDNLASGERQRLDIFLREIGAFTLMQQPINRPLVRKNYGFVVSNG